MLPQKPRHSGFLLAFISLVVLFTSGSSGKSPARPLDVAVGPLITAGDLVQKGLAVYENHAPFPIYYDEWTERASVTIADINHDGSSELLLPTYEGKIHAWSASGVELPGFPIITGWRIRGHLALGDLNLDGDLEIAAGLESPNNGVGPQIKIWEPNGQVYSGWPQNTACAQVVNGQMCAVSAIILADLDKDSNLEVIAATTNRDLTTADPSRYVPNLYVWESSGALSPGGWPNEDDHNVAIIGQMAVGDLDGDTYLDIVTGRDYNRLFAFNRLGANLSGWPHYVLYPYDNSPYGSDKVEFPRSSPALADLDQDGDLEYIIPGHRRHNDSALYYATDLLVYTTNAMRFSGWELPATGTAFVSSNTTKMIEAPAIADLTGDRQPEIILATQDGYVRAYTANKQLLWQYNYAQGREIHASETVIGDVDDDGWNEVVFGTFWVNMVTKGQVGVYILDHTGIPKTGSPILLNSVGISSSPALGDLDGDGLIEIAAATYDGWVYVWDASGQALPEKLPWPMPRHDLQRTGLYQDLTPNFSQSRKVVSTSNTLVGETVTYTIHLVRTSAPLADTLHLTDIVPAGMSYVSGSLQASAGLVDASQEPTLKWTGSMLDVNKVDIWYNAKVTQIRPGGIQNVAVLNAGTAGQFTLRAILIVNGKSEFLPIIKR